MSQGVLLDPLAVDVSAVRAVEVLEKGSLRMLMSRTVMTADGRIVDANVVIRQSADRVTFFGHVYRQDLPVQTQIRRAIVSLALSYPNQAIFCQDARRAGKVRPLRQTTAMLSLPPLSLASWINCLATVSDYRRKY